MRYSRFNLYEICSSLKNTMSRFFELKISKVKKASSEMKMLPSPRQLAAFFLPNANENAYNNFTTK